MDKSRGPYEIYLRKLREAREKIVGALTEIFVSPLTTGELSVDWKITNVVLLFKESNQEITG